MSRIPNVSQTGRLVLVLKPRIYPPLPNPKVPKAPPLDRVFLRMFLETLGLGRRGGRSSVPTRGWYLRPTGTGDRVQVSCLTASGDHGVAHLQNATVCVKQALHAQFVAGGAAKVQPLAFAMNQKKKAHKGILHKGF
eukprot:4603422-Amphidinium_carterae.1